MGACAPRDHPRIRGEHDEYKKAFTPVKGSSPHTRGAHGGRVSGEVGIGIIPAYAGSTATVRAWLRNTRDHPRIRGEHLKKCLTNPSVLGSSPHTRGALNKTSITLPSSGIIPAYAGSTVDSRLINVEMGDHPRIRGEHRLTIAMHTVAAGSSPHTRGALCS